MRASDDIKTLQLCGIAEGVEVVAAYAEAAFDFAVDRDEAALEIALRSMVAGVNFTLGFWRELATGSEQDPVARPSQEAA